MTPGEPGNEMFDVMLEHLAKVEADRQALADVRTLDAWCRTEDGCQCTVADTGSIYSESALWVCTMEGVNDHKESFRGSTPDEARAKAAAWVRGLK